MEKSNLARILSHFEIEGIIIDIKPLGNGLINDTYRVKTDGPHVQGRKTVQKLHSCPERILRIEQRDKSFIVFHGDYCGYTAAGSPAHQRRACFRSFK